MLAAYFFVTTRSCKKGNNRLQFIVDGKSK